MKLQLKDEFIGVKMTRRIADKGNISVDFNKLDDEDYKMIYDMGFQDCFNVIGKVKKYKGI